MKIRVCKVNFRSLQKAKLSNFANGVANGLYVNTTIFNTPPVKEADFNTVLSAHNAALSDYEKYGKTKKTAYYDAVNKLVEMLNQLALFVNSVANGDSSTISLAGFEPTTNVVQAAPALEKINSVSVIPSVVSGQVFIETPAIVGKGVTGYGLILKSGAPMSNQDFIDGQLRMTTEADQMFFIDFNKSRKKVVNGLDSSITYLGYMYAVNATGVSPLSEPRSIKSI